MPYLADCGAVENEFRYAWRFVAFCKNTQQIRCDKGQHDEDNLNHLNKLFK